MINEQSVNCVSRRESAVVWILQMDERAEIFQGTQQRI